MVHPLDNQKFFVVKSTCQEGFITFICGPAASRFDNEKFLIWMNHWFDKLGGNKMLSDQLIDSVIYFKCILRALLQCISPFC